MLLLMNTDTTNGEPGVPDEMTYEDNDLMTYEDNDEMLYEFET